MTQRYEPGELARRWQSRELMLIIRRTTRPSLFTRLETPSRSFGRKGSTICTALSAGLATMWQLTSTNLRHIKNR